MKYLLIIHKIGGDCLELNKIYNEDCLEGMIRIPDESIDMILCDLPYGTTSCKWDTIIPFEPLWEQYERIIKDDGAIILTASQPFTSNLVMSNLNLFKYEWVWNKSRPTDFPNANNKPMKKHENVLVFSKGTTANGSNRKMKYFPQGLISKEHKVKRTSRGFQGERHNQKNEYISKLTNYPNSQLNFPSEGKTIHPTQKPVPLFEYLIKTYTNEGETVLDNCMGSGTTAIASLNTNRNFIGFELDENYYKLANERIESHKLTI